MSVALIDVNTKRQKREFHTFTQRLYANDAEFVSHIYQDLEAIFNSDKNSEFEHGDARRWLAYKSGKVVGNIAAFYNTKSQHAGLGFFDCINDQEVANALFDKGIEWLKQNGQSRVEAPVNFGERDKYWGLMVYGFKNPSYQENYNFPYYQQLFESYGFTKIIEQTTSEGRPERIDIEKYRLYTAKLQEGSMLRAEHFTHKETQRFVHDFTTIYNQAWKQHEHYVPFSEERVAALFAEMKPIIREDILWFMYDDDKPIGFYLSLIDLNQLFRYVNGNMNWWGKLRFFYRLKTTKIKRLRGIIFGVVPEYQNKGVYSIMLMKMYEVMQNDPYLESTELAWIGDFNPRMHALFKRMNVEKTKVHYTFEKLL